MGFGVSARGYRHLSRETMNNNILHITSKEAWLSASERGGYSAPSLASEGFIHCSTSSQVPSVADSFYKGQNGLVLLVIDPARMTSPLKWEAPSGATPPLGVPQGESFPHIYGPINLEAVVLVLDFNPTPDGRFKLPTLP
jgi:uncharacterized protein (DUF952 family)